MRLPVQINPQTALMGMTGLVVLFALEAAAPRLTSWAEARSTSNARAGHVLVRDIAWHPIAVAAAGVLQKIDGQIEALLKEAAEAPKPAASPDGSPAPSPSPAAK